jgi:serine/threonine protein kinase
VLDFGLAKAVSEDRPDAAPGPAAGAPGPVPELTSYGQVLGTPAYLSPEQAADARSADIGTDSYSLGCTLHFFLAGRPPFQASSLEALLEHHRSSAPPLARPRMCPPELAVVVARMMAKAPAERFQTPVEVVRALAPSSAVGPRPGHRRPTRPAAPFPPRRSPHPRTPARRRGTT